MLAELKPNVKTTDDYREGQRLYWQGYSDGRCANPVQTQGWFDAADEDVAGRDAYLKAMSMAEADGERVDWNDVFDVVDIRYNQWGDVVR